MGYGEEALATVSLIRPRMLEILGVLLLSSDDVILSSRSSYGADELLARPLSTRTLLQDEQRVRLLLKHVKEVSLAFFG